MLEKINILKLNINKDSLEKIEKKTIKLIKNKELIR